MTLDIPSYTSYDLLFEAIHKKLEMGEIGNDTEYLADLIITLESRSRLDHAMKHALEGRELVAVED